MKKTLISLALAATALASAPAMAAFIPFSVDETVVPGVPAYLSAVGSTGQFTADNMNGKYGETLGLTSATTFSASAVGTFSHYYNGATEVDSSTSALGAAEAFGGYKMYAVFLATGTAISATQFVGTGGELHIYLDVNSNTTCNHSNFLALATCTNNGDDLEIGSSTTSYGTGDLIGPPGAFNIYFKDFALTPFGMTYWTGIDTTQFLVQTNGDIDGVTPDPTTGGVPPFEITGDFSANFAVPEPASIGLLGVALAGMGLIGRRRRNQKV